MNTSTRLPLAAFPGISLLGFDGQLFADDPSPTEVPGGQVLDWIVPDGTPHLIKTGAGTLNLLGLTNLALLEVREGQVNIPVSSTDGSLAVTADGGNVSFGAAQKLGALSISAGSQVELAAGGNLRVETAALSIDAISGSALDVQDNALIVTYLETSPLANLAQWVTSGFYNSLPAGYWGGPGIRSSVAAADQQNLHAVGLLDNNWQGAPLHEHFPPPSGNSLPLNAVIVSYAWFGDADLDSGISALDQWLLDNGLIAGLTGWMNGDFDYDGSITAFDQYLLQNAYGAMDNDGDGIPDSSDSNPYDYFNGGIPQLLPIAAADRQMATPGSFLAVPLTVRSTSNAQPLSNAPVKFIVNAGQGYLALSNGGQLRTDLTVRTDVQDYASVSYRLPPGLSVTTTISVLAGSGTNTAQTSFTAFSDSDSDGMPHVWELHNGLSMWAATDGAGDFDSDGTSNFAEFLAGSDPLVDTASAPSVTAPAAPENVFYRALSDGGYIVVWDDASDNEESFVVYRTGPGGTSVEAARAASNETYIHLPPPAAGPLGGAPVEYSVTAANRAGASAGAQGSEELLPLPDAPTGLAAKRLDKDTVRLTWSGQLDASKGDYFVVFRANNAAPWGDHTPPDKTTSWVDNNAPAGQDLRYKVVVRGPRGVRIVNSGPSNEARVDYAHVRLWAGALALYEPSPVLPPTGPFAVDSFIPDDFASSGGSVPPEPFSLPGPYPLYHSGIHVDWEFYSDQLGYFPRGKLFSTAAFIQTYGFYQTPYILIEMKDSPAFPATGFLPPPVPIFGAFAGLVQNGQYAFYDARVTGTAEEGFDAITNPNWQMVPIGNARDLTFTIDPATGPDPLPAFGLGALTPGADLELATDAALGFSPSFALPGITPTNVAEQSGAPRESELRLACLRSPIKFDVRPRRTLTVRICRVISDFAKPDPPLLTSANVAFIQARLNLVFGRQANLWFTVAIGLEQTFTASDDTVRDRICAIEFGQTGFGEAKKFLDFANTPSGGPDPTFFVWGLKGFGDKVGYTLVMSTSGMEGGSVENIPSRFAFVDSLDADTFTHEVGHMLGLEHTFVYNPSYSNMKIPDDPHDRLMGYGAGTRLIKAERDIICNQADKLSGRE